MEDRELLQEYLERQSETAFAELVARHVSLVYATALRRVGEPQMAQDIAQTVFIHLARKARSVREGNALAGWLYRVTCCAAANTLRTEQRRRQRDREAVSQAELNTDTHAAWQTLAPLLDEALQDLNRAEQDAVVLRFFEGKSLREVGEALATTDDAVQKRVSRALEKLRTHFARRGITVSSTLLLAALAVPATQAAPAGLAASLAAASFAGASSVGVAGVTTTLLKTLLMAKTKTLLVAAAGLAVVTTPIVWQYRENARLRRELAVVRQEHLSLASTGQSPSLAPPAPAASVSKVVTNVVVQPFDWRRVESADYRQYIANLRTIGCPAETVRDIVGADLRKNYAAKLDLPAQKTVLPYWQTQERGMQTALNEIYSQRAQLLGQFEASFQQLLGAAPDPAMRDLFQSSLSAGMDKQTITPQEALIADWPEDLKQKVAAVEWAYRERVRQTGSSMTTGWKTQMERMALERQREAELAAVLAPADYAEYLLRDSVTTRQMQHRLDSFRPTEEEFRKIYPDQHEFDLNWGAYGSQPTEAAELAQYQAAREQLLGNIRQALGEQRFAEYLNATQPK